MYFIILDAILLNVFGSFMHFSIDSPSVSLIWFEKLVRFYIMDLTEDNKTVSTRSILFGRNASLSSGLISESGWKR